MAAVGSNVSAVEPASREATATSPTRVWPCEANPESDPIPGCAAVKIVFHWPKVNASRQAGLIGLVERQTKTTWKRGDGIQLLARADYCEEHT